MLKRCYGAGFTLVELLIGIGVVAILLGLGMPSMSAFIQNNKIGSATANYHAGLQLARAEAIRSNLPVEFVLTNGTGVAAAPAVGGRNWVVRKLRPAVDGGPFLLDQKTGLEGEGAGAQAVQINVLAAPAGFDGRITFNGFGAPTANPYSIAISNPAVGACAPLGPARCRRINVSSGGQITACDPAAAAGDTREC